MSNLSELAGGDDCTVTSVAAESPEMRSRLYALGIVPGASLQVLRKAPLGDPLQIKVGGSFVSIRRSEAASITIEK